MGFLKNLIGKKSEKTARQGNVILSMPLFKGEQAYVLSDVIEDLKSYWGLEIKAIEGDNTTATFVIDGELVALALMPLPIPTEELEPLYDYAYLWDGVAQEVEAHTMHAIVSVLSGSEEPLKSYSILSKVNASILRTSENAIGIYQGAATLLLPKNLYINFAELMKEDSLPISLWVYIGIVNDGEKRNLYTYGMKEFGKAEIEIINSAKAASDLYDFLLSILDYILSEDVILSDGETIGFSEEEKIKITASKAVYLEGESLKLEL